MNSRDLLCAIAGADEALVRESARFSAIAAGITAERKRKRRRVLVAGAVAVPCAAVFGLVKLLPRSARPVMPYPTAEDPSAKDGTATHEEENASVPSGEQDPAASAETETPPPDTENGKEASAFAEAPDLTQTQPPAEESSAPPANGTTEPQGSPGGPGAVFTDRDVSFEEAREKFGRPIAPCTRADFIGYRAGTVSVNGDVNDSRGVCISVSYVFTGGLVRLTDQDRMAGETASAFGERYDYRGRTFYVQTQNDYPGVYEDRILIGYFPSWNVGIAYQADFSAKTDVYGIMDLMIGLETE